MKLFYSKGACSLACRIIINELGISSEYESVDLHSKQKLTETGELFLKINPKGAVPTLITDEGETLTENGVILQYLAEKARAYELFPPVEDFERYRILEWLNFIATDLHKNLGILFNPAVTKEMREEVFIPIIKSKFNFINQQLEENNFLFGKSFTLPDAYLFVMITWLYKFKIPGDWQNVQRYYNSLIKRASIQQSLKDEKLLLTPA